MANGRACAATWGGVHATLRGIVVSTNRIGAVGIDGTTPRGLVSTGAQQQVPSCMQPVSTGVPWCVASPCVPGIPGMDMPAGFIPAVATTDVCIVARMSHDMSGAGWARIATNQTAQHLAINRDQREWRTGEG